MNVNRKLPMSFTPGPPPANPTVRRILAETSRTMLAYVRRRPRRSGEWTDIHRDNRRLFIELDERINDAEVRFWRDRVARYEDAS